MVVDAYKLVACLRSQVADKAGLTTAGGTLAVQYTTAAQTAVKTVHIPLQPSCCTMQATGVFVMCILAREPTIVLAGA
jgi:hypothetical protein